MKAVDLRIGNYVKCVDGNIICIDIDDMMYILSNTFEIKPIPLTEEILLKCGFDDNVGNNSYQLDSNLGFTIWGRIGSGFNVYVDDVEFGETIYYLHQLQNLYYALTGQELGILL